MPDMELLDVTFSFTGTPANGVAAFVNVTDAQAAVHRLTIASAVTTWMMLSPPMPVRVLSLSYTTGAAQLAFFPSPEIGDAAAVRLAFITLAREGQFCVPVLYSIDDNSNDNSGLCLPSPPADAATAAPEATTDTLDSPNDEDDGTATTDLVVGASEDDTTAGQSKTFVLAVCVAGTVIIVALVFIAVQYSRDANSGAKNLPTVVENAMAMHAMEQLASPPHRSMGMSPVAGHSAVPEALSLGLGFDHLRSLNGSPDMPGIQFASVAELTGETSTSAL